MRTVRLIGKGERRKVEGEGRKVEGEGEERAGENGTEMRTEEMEKKRYAPRMAIRAKLQVCGLTLLLVAPMFAEDPEEERLLPLPFPVSVGARAYFESAYFSLCISLFQI